MSDIEYKTGDIDSVGVAVKQNGFGMDLTGYTVTCVLKNNATGAKFILNCTPGARVNGTDVLVSQGGVTIPFSSTATADAGTLKAELVATKTGSTIHIPSGNNYMSVTIYESL
jgi:hypothetical protein